MDFLIDSFLSAALLIWSMDPELLVIIHVSLKVSCTSTILASIVGIPAGFIIAFTRPAHRGGRALCLRLHFAAGNFRAL
jgi:tungstate transport system permease protein